jgi:NADH-quinone oxidoreductase subunit L
MNVNTLGWIGLFLPLGAATLITLFTRRQRNLSAALSIGAILISFVTVLALLGSGAMRNPMEITARWLEVGPLTVDFGLRLDSLSLLMAFVVTGVGGLIHIYSFGYMHDDPNFSRYFASLSLFTFSMLGIVFSTNFVQMFIFWELVGVSSYLLIGFWHARESAADAAKKAFLCNRIGDFGFLLGIIIVWSIAGTVNFGELRQHFADHPALLGSLATAAGVLVFGGAVGKSAQFPLHVWLPDAMEGPTPVSALIHAATMVAAGVYMLCRVFFLFDASSLEVIAWIGGVTSLLAAVIAVQQNDIKRILAYSTLSQLGYMVMTVGLSGPAASMFHLTTHAFFKALLFLGAGSVIHTLHHEQDIWKMGGLRFKMPITYWTFLAATLALCGVPPFSGFFSKDEVLANAYEHNIALFVVAVVVAALTTFYMLRLFLVAFAGRSRSDAAGHAHESPGVMTRPLILLAIPSVIGGLLGIHGVFERFFEPEAVHAGRSFFDALFGPFSQPVPALFGLLAILSGGAGALYFYASAVSDPLPEMARTLTRSMRNRFYFDEIYDVLIGITQETIAALVNGVDQWIVSGFFVRGAHGLAEFLGRALRLLQTGNLNTYAFLLAAGATLLFYLVLFR